MFKAIKELFFGIFGRPAPLIDTTVAPYKVEPPTLVEVVLATLPKKPLGAKKGPVPSNWTAIAGNRTETVAKRQDRPKKKPAAKK